MERNGNINVPTNSMDEEELAPMSTRTTSTVSSTISTPGPDVETILANRSFFWNGDVGENWEAEADDEYDEQRTGMGMGRIEGMRSGHTYMYPMDDEDATEEEMEMEDLSDNQDGTVASNDSGRKEGNDKDILDILPTYFQHVSFETIFDTSSWWVKSDTKESRDVEGGKGAKEGSTTATTAGGSMPGRPLSRKRSIVAPLDQDDVSEKQKTSRKQEIGGTVVESMLANSKKKEGSTAEFHDRYLGIEPPPAYSDMDMTVNVTIRHSIELENFPESPIKLNSSLGMTIGEMKTMMKQNGMFAKCKDKIRDLEELTLWSDNEQMEDDSVLATMLLCKYHDLDIVKESIEFEMRYEPMHFSMGRAALLEQFEGAAGENAGGNRGGGEGGLRAVATSRKWGMGPTALDDIHHVTALGLLLLMGLAILVPIQLRLDNELDASWAVVLSPLYVRAEGD